MFLTSRRIASGPTERGSGRAPNASSNRVRTDRGLLPQAAARATPEAKKERRRESRRRAKVTVDDILGGSAAKVRVSSEGDLKSKLLPEGEG